MPALAAELIVTIVPNKFGWFFRYVANPIDGQTRNAEGDAIVSVEDTDLPKDAEHPFRIGIAKSEKIEIARRTMRIIEPGGRQHRALEDKPVAMLGGAEPIKEALMPAGRGEQPEIRLAGGLASLLPPNRRLPGTMVAGAGIEPATYGL